MMVQEAKISFLITVPPYLMSEVMHREQNNTPEVNKHKNKQQAAE